MTPRTYEEITTLVKKLGTTRWHRREHIFGVKGANGWRLFNYKTYFTILGVVGEVERGYAYKALEELNMATDEPHTKYEYEDEVEIDERVVKILAEEDYYKNGVIT